MTAGVPGAGIAGLFYLAGALLAPAVEMRRAWRDRRHRRTWRFVLRLAGLAASMLAGIYAVGLLIGFAVTAPAIFGASAGAPVAGSTTPQFIARAAVLFTIGTLIVVLLGVEVLRIAFGARRTAARRRAAGAPISISEHR